MSNVVRTLLVATLFIAYRANAQLSVGSLPIWEIVPGNTDYYTEGIGFTQVFGWLGRANTWGKDGYRYRHEIGGGSSAYTIYEHDTSGSKTFTYREVYAGATPRTSSAMLSQMNAQGAEGYLYVYTMWDDGLWSGTSGYKERYVRDNSTARTFAYVYRPTPSSASDMLLQMNERGSAGYIYLTSFGTDTFFVKDTTSSSTYSYRNTSGSVSMATLNLQGSDGYLYALSFRFASTYCFYVKDNGIARSYSYQALTSFSTVTQKNQLGSQGYRYMWAELGSDWFVKPGTGVASTPNLTPSKIVVSKTTGTTVDSSPLLETDALYVDWAVLNNGTAATPVGFKTALYVDNLLKTSWSHQPLSAGLDSGVSDYSLGSLSVGTHLLIIVTDWTGVIAESNENDNDYRKTITVLAGPTLSVAPGKRQVSAVAGTTTFTVANTGSGAFSYTASESESWLSVTGGGSGGNSGTITLAYGANTGRTSRTGTITVTAAGAIGSPATVSITQLPMGGGAEVVPGMPWMNIILGQ